ncbi:hypothetical protein M8C21_005204 [Ambrosia artemisiifolia]|uniref:Transmembrane protein n=1 Tax=Ambrosia artemisiifolia TaxID=4212 RepID=A0AAD5GB79_AMBAR|nr:hypothetical protein M8C21_005204 [Ambrosia artemisiifolia]
MASIINLHSLYSPLSCSSTSKTLAFSFRSPLLSKPLFKSKKHSIIPIVQTRTCRSQINASQSNFFKVVQTVFKVGRDGIEAGTSLVPESIPRPIARVSVAVVGVTVALFLLKSFLSTAFFFLATIGLIYSAFIALNKDEAPTRGSDNINTTSSSGTTTSSDEETLEEARRIMEKYK